MNKEILNILNNFSNDTITLHRLIVTLFLKINNCKINNNELIKSYLISDDVMLSKIFASQLPIYDNIQFTFEDLIEIFELVVPKSDKVTNGAVYTPRYIKEFIVNQTIKDLQVKINEAKFCDISCGCGGFLFVIAKEIKRQTGKSYKDIISQNIFGLDISDYSIERAKILLSLLAISEGEDEIKFNFNLFIGNALDFDWFSKVQSIKFNNGFDAIVGNPPYVRAKNIEHFSKKLLANWNVTKSGNPDLYIPFFEIGIKFLNPSGVLGYITVNSFYKSINARELRRYFQENQFEMKILNFGDEKIFGNKSAYTCICFIRPFRQSYISFAKITSGYIKQNLDIHYNKISYSSLESKKGWLLSGKDIIEKIKRIENCGIPLHKLFKIKNGIATLSNNIYIFKPIDENGKYFIHEVNGNRYLIEKTICKDIIKPNILKIEDDIEKFKEKLIFPYFNGNNTLTLFDEDYFRENFPNAYKYLQSNIDRLRERDKGNGDYGGWYAYGRTQAFNDKGFKLLFPYIAKQPYFIYTSQKDLLIYCGYAIFSNNPKELLVLKKILESDLFWYYIKHTSKPYSAGFFSLAKNYVKNFGICNLNEDEKNFLLNTENKERINKFLYKKYNVILENESF